MQSGLGGKLSCEVINFSFVHRLLRDFECKYLAVIYSVALEEKLWMGKGELGSMRQSVKSITGN